MAQPLKLDKPDALIYLGYHNTIPKARWLKQHTFISQSFRDWEVQDQGADQLNSW